MIPILNVFPGPRRDDADSPSGSLSNGSSTEEKPPSKARFLTFAIGKLVLGTVVCAIFSDPMVDAVSNFSGVRLVSSHGRTTAQPKLCSPVECCLPLSKLHCNARSAHATCLCDMDPKLTTVSRHASR